MTTRLTGTVAEGQGRVTTDRDFSRFAELLPFELFAA